MSSVSSIRQDLEDELANQDGVVVAFSGGVDSSVVAASAHEALGDDALAVTIRGPTFPASEIDQATQVADEIGIRHEFVSIDTLESEDFVSNDAERCYHCRTMEFDTIFEVATKRGIETVCDGTTASDMGDGHRPGLRAREEYDVFSPLLENDLSKSEVRSVAEEYGLSVADAPSNACLASRIPTGQQVTKERLERIQRAEAFVREWGFSQFRVRDHEGLARIEVGPDELESALDPEFAREARERLADIGFEHVTVDLEGYRTGSVSPAGTET